MPHLSELHGAATHLAVIALPVYAAVALLRRFGRDTPTLEAIEPWLLAAAVAGVAAAGATGLLVWGQAQTTLRGHAFRTGTAHFWIGIGLAALLLVILAGRVLGWRSATGARAGVLLLGAAVLATGLVFVQGYLGGRMTYDQAVGVDRGGQLAQSAAGADRLNLALARGVAPAQAGQMAFSTTGLGCASCHGALAQGQRGPSLAGGRGLDDFRRVHGHGLFPPTVVSDADFRALDAWLRTVGGPRSRRR